MFLHLLLSLYSHHSALFTKQTLFASVVVSSVKGWVHTYHIAVFISSRINCRFNVWNTVIRRLEKSCHCCFISSPLFYHLVLANIWGINEGPWFVRRKKQKAGQFLLVYLKKRSRESQPKSIFTSQHRILNTGNVLVISKCGPRACFMPSLRRCLWAECWIIDETRSWIKRQVCLCLCLSVCTSFSLCECVCVWSIAYNNVFPMCCVCIGLCALEKKKVHRVSCSFSDRLLLQTEICRDYAVCRNACFLPDHLSVVWGFSAVFALVLITSSCPSHTVISPPKKGCLCFSMSGKLDLFC